MPYIFVFGLQLKLFKLFGESGWRLIVDGGWKWQKESFSPFSTHKLFRSFCRTKFFLGEDRKFFTSKKYSCLHVSFHHVLAFRPVFTELTLDPHRAVLRDLVLGHVMRVLGSSNQIFGVKITQKYLFPDISSEMNFDNQFYSILIPNTPHGKNKVSQELFFFNQETFFLF